MSLAPTHIDFRANVQRVPPEVPLSVRKATAKFLGNRQTVVDILGDAQWQALRQAGHDARQHAIQHLDYYLAQFEEQAVRAGGVVHWAGDADAARRIVLDIAREHDVRRVVKSKSMATEEVGLNHALQTAGVQVLETDLGEYIVQLAGVMPSHILVPAVHMTKEGIAGLFRERLGIDAHPDPENLTNIARARLRDEFIAADMGISGANFLVAETGTLVLVTNEGNGRMTTTLPPLHVAVVGIDKIIPDWPSLAVLLKLLARSATGQKISTFTSFITGPRHAEGEGGPRELHLVLLDNGRTRTLRDPVARDALLCIRCGACANICPVYNSVGGHAYGWIYSGPIGAILSPQLLGTAVAGDLPFASSLCGACADICPVKVPIPQILLRLRHRVVAGDEVEQPVAPALLTMVARIGTLSFGLPLLYELATLFLRLIQWPFRQAEWLPALPPPLDRWTGVRPFPAVRNDFRAFMRKRSPAGRALNTRRRIGFATLAVIVISSLLWLSDRRRK